MGKLFQIEEWLLLLIKCKHPFCLHPVYCKLNFCWHWLGSYLISILSIWIEILESCNGSVASLCSHSATDILKAFTMHGLCEWLRLMIFLWKLQNPSGVEFQGETYFSGIMQKHEKGYMWNYKWVGSLWSGRRDFFHTLHWI